jgi:glycerate kinase
MICSNLIKTRELKFDSQSSNGKVIEHISKLGNQFEVPVIALCGITDISQSEILSSGLTAAYQLVNGGISQQFAIANAEKLLIQLSQSVSDSFFRTS